MIKRLVVLNLALVALVFSGNVLAVNYSKEAKSFYRSLKQLETDYTQCAEDFNAWSEIAVQSCEVAKQAAVVSKDKGENISLKEKKGRFIKKLISLFGTYEKDINNIFVGLTDRETQQFAFAGGAGGHVSAVVEAAPPAVADSPIAVKIIEASDSASAMFVIFEPDHLNESELHMLLSDFSNNYTDPKVRIDGFAAGDLATELFIEYSSDCAQIVALLLPENDINSLSVVSAAYGHGDLVSQNFDMYFSDSDVSTQGAPPHCMVGIVMSDSDEIWDK